MGNYLGLHLSRVNAGFRKWASRDESCVSTLTKSMALEMNGRFSLQTFFLVHSVQVQMFVTKFHIYFPTEERMQGLQIKIMQNKFPLFSN